MHILFFVSITLGYFFHWFIYYASLVFGSFYSILFLFALFSFYSNFIRVHYILFHLPFIWNDIFKYTFLFSCTLLSFLHIIVYILYFLFLNVHYFLEFLLLYFCILMAHLYIISYLTGMIHCCNNVIKWYNMGILLAINQ